MHSSNEINSQVSQCLSENTKYYYLPLYPDTQFSSLLQTALGTNNHKLRTSAEIRESLRKALLGRYSHVKVPWDRTEGGELSEILAGANSLGLGVVLQVATQFLSNSQYFEELQNLAGFVEIEWVLDNVEPLPLERIANIEAYKAHFSIVVHKDLDWSKILTPSLLKMTKRFHLYFPYELETNDIFLNCKDSYQVVNLLRSQYSYFEFLPPKGVDLWDCRASHDFDMEPYVLPCFESSSANPDIQWSVIIPTFNNQNHLRVVLNHIYQQNVGLDNFEVIIVDDGSTDKTQALLLEALRSFPQAMNLKYVFFPRERQRVMGDSQYRAGISRNLGVKNAIGEILCFLDSDIVVPSNYLQRVKLALAGAEAVQAKRINLSRSASSLQFDYEKVCEERDCIPDEPYWEDFIKTENWSALPFSWKYVCTHSFSLKKDLFWKVGGLKRNFIYYGFEDTDFGYRLVKGGAKLDLLDLRVYHMFHENNRSEFLNLNSLRHVLLSRTAQIFYRHHLDNDIYKNLIGFMQPEPSFARVWKKLSAMVRLENVGKQKVLKSLKATRI